MPPRSIASLSLNFGLVSIPIKLYPATESSAAIRFKLMAASGTRVRQQYVAEAAPVEEPSVAKPQPEAKQGHPIPNPRAALSKVVDFPRARYVTPPPDEPRMPALESLVERSSMVKGYEYEKGKFVLFNAKELAALQAGSQKTIDIVSFIPEKTVDPIFFDKAYLLAPDKGGSKPYQLLLRALQDTGRCALARWAFRSKAYVVQIRAAVTGLVLQQLHYADEVRSFSALHIEPAEVKEAELDLAKRFIGQLSAESYDPKEFVDEEKARILEAVQSKLAGKQMRTPASPPGGGQVINLLEALRASLRTQQGLGATARSPSSSLGQRKAAKKASSKRAGASTASLKSKSHKL
jgi:DNA end-binding protein Ku